MNVVTNLQIITNEIRLTNNYLPEGEFDVNPQFARETGETEDGKYYTKLSVNIADTQESRFPINLFISITGIFELNNLDKSQINSFLSYTGVQILFPYLRSLMSSVTACALMPPIIFPVIDAKTLFQDDTDKETEKKNDKEKNK